MTERHSYTEEPDLIKDPRELAAAEARNALRQFDVGMLMLDRWLDHDGYPHLRPSDLLILNRFALEGVNRFAGTFRTSEIKISGSRHAPPEFESVPALVEDFCDYINDNWNEQTAIHLSAYALWRLNWIHPFVDGNGRTARIISYIILCAKLGYKLPGEVTIPEQISNDKDPYYKALEAADTGFQKGILNLSLMESLLKDFLAGQLISIHDEASGENNTESSDIINNGIQSQLLEEDIEKYKLAILPIVYRTAKTDDSHIASVLEKNPILFTGIFTILAAVLGSLLTLFFAR